jgi:hypothetical protein
MLTTPPLAVLGLEPGGLDLGLLDEVRGHPGAEGAEDDRVRPHAAEAGVGDVHAVDDVGVVEAARAADGRVGLADPAGVADARHEVERVREVASHRQALQLGAVEDAADGRRCRVHHRRCAQDLDCLGQTAQLQDEIDAASLAQAYLHVLPLERYEAL